MRNFPLYNLYWQDFEELVVLICERILGNGTINFSTGADGGRDAGFTGRAENFPSKASPWEGTFIIQAKHTEKPTAKCSDYDFERKLKDEVNNRLKTLVDNNELDYYLVFTNRKLSGIADAKISDFIDTNLGVENRVIGDERIQLWLKKYPDIGKALNLNKLFLPLEFYEKDLQEIIIKFSEMKKELGDTAGRDHEQLKYIDKTRKNELNKLGKDYFDFMRKNSLTYFNSIQTFLEDPINRNYREYYDNTVSDLQAKILIKRDEFFEFETILEDLYDYVLQNSPELKDRRRVIRVFLHYMYFNCDIGVKG